jgi:hypothetical protein
MIGKREERFTEEGTNLIRREEEIWRKRRELIGWR